MKIKRIKNYKKIVQFYKTNYGFSEPFHILMDPDFLKKSIGMNINFREVIPKLLEAPRTFFYMTSCCLSEMRKCGTDVYPLELLNIAKKVEQIHCYHTHDDKARAGPADYSRSCFQRLLQKGEKKFMVAAQDHDTRVEIRKNAGVPLLFVLTNMVILEKPTTLSYQGMIKTHKLLTAVNNQEKELLLKKKLGDKYVPPVTKKQYQPTPTPATPTTTTSTKTAPSANIPKQSINKKAPTTTTTTTTTTKTETNNSNNDTTNKKRKLDDVEKKEQPIKKQEPKEEEKENTSIKPTQPTQPTKPAKPTKPTKQPNKKQKTTTPTTITTSDIKKQEEKQEEKETSKESEDVQKKKTRRKRSKANKKEEGQ
ncbi:hypothetical protein CYY_004914 [Polysphondylium violaceum]|uniref:Uncharacterized protein n=1 Tax=Polysphondylium violaceum TaxID=133409 RepID=A0A8J4PUG2_9MYCE|nr:hypothetical protein CYY_004914 [Polysphondylium violaceum]